MSDSYIDQIKGVFTKLQNVHLSHCKPADGYLKFEKKGDNIQITLDTHLVHIERSPMSGPGVVKLKEHLQAAGVEDAQIINRYFSSYNKTLYGDNTDGLPYNVADNFSHVPQLVVTVPDSMDSVMKIAAAFRSSAVEAASDSVSAGIKRAQDIVAQLGAEAGPVMEEVLRKAGLTAARSKAKV